MNVKELKEQLQQMNEDLEIQIYDSYNDWYMDVNNVHVNNVFGKNLCIIVTE